MKKRALSLLLCLSLLLGLCPPLTWAEEGLPPEEQETQEAAPVEEPEESEPPMPLVQQNPQMEEEPEGDPEPEPDPVRLTFTLSPAETQISLFTDGEEPELISPQGDGSYLLLPGNYVYFAFAQGYYLLRDQPLTVTEGQEELALEVTLEDLGNRLYITETNFPDAALRKYLLETLPIEKDEEDSPFVYRADYELVTELDVSGLGIESLEGIAAFTALEKLNCAQNKLAALDVSRNSALKVLSCAQNRITALDLSANAALEELDCSGNGLAWLDLSANESLTLVACGGQTLTPQPLVPFMEESYLLDIGHLVPDKAQVLGTDYDSATGMATLMAAADAYTYLYAVGWQEAQLEVTCLLQVQEPALWLNADTFPDAALLAALMDQVPHNLLEGSAYLTEEQVEAVTALDLGGLGIVNIQGLGRFANLEALNLGSATVDGESRTNALTVLDLSENEKLTTLYVQDNPLTELFLGGNGELEVLDCSGCQLTNLDLSQNVALLSLTCSNNPLEGLELTTLLELKELFCENCGLTELDLSKNTKLEQLYCANNQLAELDLNQCVNLILLSCQNNQLEELKLEKLRRIQRMAVGNNPLTSLAVDRYHQLIELNCSGCELSDLDVSGSKYLLYLVCSNNRIGRLDLHKNTYLRQLNCGDNWLQSLDVSTCGQLQILSCEDNRLSELDVSGCTALVQLVCNDNRLKTLDVSKNANLRQLQCRGNGLFALDLSQNSALSALRCGNNHLTALDVSANRSLGTISCNGQTLLNQSVTEAEGQITFDLGPLVPDVSKVTLTLEGAGMDENGLVTFTEAPETLTYTYTTGFVDMDVTVRFYHRIEITDGSLADGEQVEVDGVPYTVADGAIALPSGVNPGFITRITYTQAEDIHGQYPTDLQVWAVEESRGSLVAKRVEELDNVLQYAGSSIRASGTKGIRMITSVPEDTRSLLTSGGVQGYTLLEYGTLLEWDSVLDGQPLTLAWEGAKSNHAYKKGEGDPVYAYTSGLIQYTNVIVGFTMEQCAPDLTMRPYMKLLSPTGETLTLYGGLVHRSIGYIAWQNRQAFAPGSKAYRYIWDIIHAVYGDIYDEEYAQ
ncbi:MAG: hypothetical protein IJR17_06005 [Clostridia bacterium]|nr:hypothetical protein [Clostridia bacterium]